MDLVIVTVEYILCGIGIWINSYVHMGLPIWVISSKCKWYLNIKGEREYLLTFSECLCH